MEDSDGQMGTNFTKALNGFLAAFGYWFVHVSGQCPRKSRTNAGGPRPRTDEDPAWSVVTPYRLSSWRVETWSLRRLRADSVVAVAVLTEEDQRSAGAGQVQACSSDGQPSACFRDRSAISAKKLTANWRRRAAEQAGGRGLATANTA
nr:hypothetical protein Iba_chr13cCG18470 [Ipomoea batatas]